MHIENAITTEQARHLHRNTPIVVLTNVVGAAVVSAVYLDTIEPSALLPWLLAFLLQTCYRLGLWHRFRHSDFRPSVAHYWFRLSLIGSLFAVALWSLGMLLFFTIGSFMQHFAFWCVTMLVGVSSTFTQGPHYPRRFLLGYFPLLIPLICLMVHAEVICCGVLSAIAGFALLLLFYAQRFNKLLTDSLQLRFENLDLVNQLRAQKKIAETANMAKSRFLAAASHDLRQPIHALSIHLQSLAACTLPAKAEALVNDASECCDSMNDLFRSLLDVSRLDSQAVQPLYSSFALQPLLERLVSEYRPQAQAKSVALSLRPCRAWVHSDPTLVERVLRNLISNAVRYTQAGRIIVGCRRQGNAVRLGVYDSGQGIAADQQALIFEEFYQINKGSSHSAHGLGLGLNIVQRMTQLLGSQVTVRSIPERGSAFSFVLPLASTEQTRTSALPATAVRFRPLEDALIVVIGRGGRVAEIAAALKAARRCHVIATETSQQALECLSNCTLVPCALICCAADSDQAIRRLRDEFNQAIPALILPGEESRTGCEAMDDTVVLPESTSISTLLQTLRRLEDQVACSMV
ncbi:HAMP domain-containing histidine kinase [Chitinimonas arctica]|uniref:histidine kinase n=1 Tax=Chitinimonas arctica TaxID=2594795 RepID=A0A516SBB8_9NEIS|nr:HAMP domain-containing sensor histidine kinase [Chitinimonas arctica]QDQ25444.1 HAMP domain-containing histidine kinase [Chitinimonas arctica]